MNEIIVLDKPDQIKAAQLLALKGMLKLETKGMKRSAGKASAYSIIKRMFPDLKDSTKVKLLPLYIERLRELGILRETLQSSVSPRDEFTQPFRIVLHPSSAYHDEWVTHVESLIEVEEVRVTSHLSKCGRFSSKSIRDFNWGNYFRNDYAAAYANYKIRCLKYKLTP